LNAAIISGVLSPFFLSPLLSTTNTHAQKAFIVLFDALQIPVGVVQKVMWMSVIFTVPFVTCCLAN
jgi:hypothetical protein